MKKPKNSYKIITSKLVLDPEVEAWVRKDMGVNPRGYRNLPSRATEFFHWYSEQRKGFLISLIQNHYQEIKHLMRIIGKARKDLVTPK